ncbi:SMC family ATPase [soil metagenome]
MVIKQIELYNFRIYKGKNILNLESKKGKNIFVISGRNGFGKTTLLMSLVWCLYGKNMSEVDDLYKKEIEDQGGYSKYIASSLNRLSKTEEDHKFHVTLSFTNINIQEVPCKEIVIKRSYNALQKNEEVEVLIDGYQSEIAKEVGQEIFIREFIMPIEIAKFFFFDAEKIVNLAEVTTNEQRKRLSRAYSEVLGIKKYEDLKSNLESLQLKIRQESASTTEKNLLEQLKADVVKFENLILENQNKQLDYKEQRIEKNNELRSIQEKLIREGSIITVEELQKLREQEEELIIKQNVLQNELKVSYDLIPFAVAGEKFLEVSLQLESENNFKTAQFKDENVKGITNKILTDLMNTPKPHDLAIDHRVDKYYCECIEKLIRKYFFSDTPQLPENFKTLHDFSESEKSELFALLNNVKLSFKETFKRITSEYYYVRNEMMGIRKKIKDAETNQENPIISELRKRKEELEKDILKIDDTIDSINREIGEYNNEKIQKEKRIEELSRKLIVSEKNKDKDAVTSRNIANLKDFIAEFKMKKKKSLETQILEGLETLMHKKNFIKKVEVEIIGDNIDIILKNKRNQEIKKESLSKGEQQMFATALLRGLVEESDIQFPVFIDSPMQKFDEQHAENIVKYFYPNISEQVVIFPLMNKELTESEYKGLSKNMAKTFIISNIHEDKSEFKEVPFLDLFKVYNQMYKNAD